MMNYIRFNKLTGEILSAGETDYISNSGVSVAFPDELVIEGIASVSLDTICIDSHKVLPNTRVVPKVLLTHAEARKNHYPSIAIQLDMLWHAMDSGEIPKSPAFYEAIKVVKDTFPKGETFEKNTTILYNME